MTFDTCPAPTHLLFQNNQLQKIQRPYPSCCLCRQFRILIKYFQQQFIVSIICNNNHSVLSYFLILLLNILHWSIKNVFHASWHSLIAIFFLCNHNYSNHILLLSSHNCRYGTHLNFLFLE